LFVASTAHAWASVSYIEAKTALCLFLVIEFSIQNDHILGCVIVHHTNWWWPKCNYIMCQGYDWILDYWKIQFGHNLEYKSTEILEDIVSLVGHLVVSLETIGISGYNSAFHHYILRIVIHCDSEKWMIVNIGLSPPSLNHAKNGTMKTCVLFQTFLLSENIVN